MEMLIFYISFGVCFVCYAIRTSYYVLANRGSEFVENKKFVIFLFITMFFLWFSWFYLSFNDLYKMSLPSWVRYTGLALFIIGVFPFLFSHIIIRGQETDKLITTGIYSKIRHPMYYGFIIWIVGFPIFTNAAFTLASAIIWIPQILYWRVSEERKLEQKYPDYKEYKSRTWF